MTELVLTCPRCGGDRWEDVRPDWVRCTACLYQQHVPVERRGHEANMERLRQIALAVPESDIPRAASMSWHWFDDWDAPGMEVYDDLPDPAAAMAGIARVIERGDE